MYRINEILFSKFLSQSCKALIERDLGPLLAPAAGDQITIIRFPLLFPFQGQSTQCKTLFCLIDNDDPLYNDSLLSIEHSFKHVQ